MLFTLTHIIYIYACVCLYICIYRVREDNIKMDLQELECRGMDWIDLTQDKDRRRALVNAVMNLRVPYNTGNFLTS